MIAIIIEKKLRKLDKFDGAKVKTSAGVITEWSVSGVAQPTSADLAAWETELQSDKVAEKLDRKNKKQALLAKLKIDAADLPALKALIEDGDDE